MTIFKKFKYKILAGLAAAGLIFGAAAPVFAAEVDDATSTATVSFNGGDLELLQVSNLDFGTRDISNVTENYPSSNDATIQVGDYRGDPTGWTLNATLSNFTNNTSGTAVQVLQGASINVNGATATPLVTGNTSTPTPNPSVSLVAGGGSEEIATAADGAGNGGWRINWNTANTSLQVLPDTARVGQATATITWSLEDVA